jgi:spore germination cell wall hydrolase CwlJ-like protein
MAQAADARAKTAAVANAAAPSSESQAAAARSASVASPAAASHTLAVTRVSTVPAQPFRLADDAAQASSRDLDCLADAIYYEARGETPAGQAAVAQVVLNRVRHPAFPKSVCGVVFQGARAGYDCQFSFACDGSMRRPKDGAAWARAEQIAARALAGSVMPQVGEATHFHVAGVEPGWGPRLLKVAQVGLHVFYRFGGHAGSGSAFDRAAQPSAPGSDGPRTAYASMLPDLGISADGHAPAAFGAATSPASAPTGPAAAPPALAPRPASADAGKPKSDADTAAAKPTQVASVS